MFPFWKARDKNASDDSNAQGGGASAARAALLWRQGSKFLERKKYDAAIDSMREALKLEPSRLEGRLNMGAALFMTKQFDEAVTHLKYVLAFEPQNAMALLNLAACFDGLGRIEDSIEALETLVADRPGWKDAHYNLAVAYFKAKNYDKAEVACKAELQINPHNEAARTLLNRIYLMPKGRIKN